MLNKVLLIGNLTRDPELRYTANGTPVCNLGLAVSNRRREEEVLFIDVSCWGSQAESVATYMTKGRQVMIEGRLTFRQWEQEGVKRSRHEVVADSVQFMGKPGETQENGETPVAAAAGDDDLPF